MNKLTRFIEHLKDYACLNEKSVVIYQMGKVGSSSIERELKKKGIHVIHTHKLYPSDVFFYDLSRIDKLKKIRTKFHNWLTYQIFKRKKCKVITIVRDPLKRNLSQMFHHLDLLIYLRNKENTRREVDANELFLEIFKKDINLAYATDWFEKEFFPSLDINYNDIFFSKESKCSKIIKHNKEILIIKFEDINNIGEVISDFCNIGEFEIHRANDSKDKWYSSLYRDFSKTLVIDELEYKKMYSGNFYELFYKDEV
ncbi:putative capsular polysaccharide synthesis family protein [Vibrio splendidus]